MSIFLFSSPPKKQALNGNRDKGKKFYYFLSLIKYKNHTVDFIAVLNVREKVRSRLRINILGILVSGHMSRLFRKHFWE